MHARGAKCVTHMMYSYSGSYTPVHERGPAITIYSYMHGHALRDGS